MISKRKTSSMPAVAMDEGDGHASKKRKLPPNGETPENTTQVGLGFLDLIKSTRDKRNRLIATHFLTLPDRKKLPQYYLQIGLPMALDTVEGKLHRREYPNLTTLECDLRRMVSNAKSFNEKSSELFSDAEKIRKLVVSFMTKHNPAYETGGYTPYSTPVPVGWQNRLQTESEAHDIDADGETDPDEAINTTYTASVINATHATTTTKAADNREASLTPVIQDAEGAGESFEGNNFQQAQDKLLTEMINLKNDKDELLSTPFLNLPSRDLRDYYRLIKHPVCLKGVQKAARGIKGREKPTGQTLLTSWQAFEDEMKYIWRNAREYNEDGSEISNLAGELESYFNRRLAEAKRVVAEPSHPKVKLRLSARSPETNPKITLRFGGQKSGAGVSVDSEALKRQQDLVKAGVNGQGAINVNGIPRAGLTSLGPGLPNSVSQESPRSASAERPTQVSNGIKNEVPLRQSPALSAIQPSGDLSESVQTPHSSLSNMPPPSSVTPRPPSNSPHPSGAPTPPSVDSRLRQPGKGDTGSLLIVQNRLTLSGASDALISNLSISTDPGLKLDQHFHLDIAPLSTTTHQSVTITLPKTHHYLRIVPTIASHVMQRPSKIFVTLGLQRLSAIPQRAEDNDPRRPLYEARVLPGVNRIEVEMVAGMARGNAKAGPGQEIELEKITVFVNVARK